MFFREPYKLLLHLSAHQKWEISVGDESWSSKRHCFIHVHVFKIGDKGMIDFMFKSNFWNQPVQSNQKGRMVQLKHLYPWCPDYNLSIHQWIKSLQQFALVTWCFIYFFLISRLRPWLRHKFYTDMFNFLIINKHNDLIK